MKAAAPPRLEVRLKSAEALRGAMRFGRYNVRELAEACGNPRHRSTIGHLHSGARNRCSHVLAGRIERVLHLPPGTLFDLRVTTSHVVAEQKIARRAAA